MCSRILTQLHVHVEIFQLKYILIKVQLYVHVVTILL